MDAPPTTQCIRGEEVRLRLARWLAAVVFLASALVGTVFPGHAHRGGSARGFGNLRASVTNLTHSGTCDSRIKAMLLVEHFLPNLPRFGGVLFGSLVCSRGWPVSAGDPRGGTGLFPSNSGPFRGTWGTYPLRNLLPRYQDGIERRPHMSRGKDKSDRDLKPAPPAPADDAETPARSPDQSEILETFDEAIRHRFGKLISAAAVKPPKRRRRS